MMIRFQRLHFPGVRSQKLAFHGRRLGRFTVWMCLGLSISAINGCIEIQQFIAAPPLTDDGGSQSGPGSGEPGGSEEPTDPKTGEVPVVRLAVSNPSPQLNEEVLLSCVVENETTGSIQFEFQPDDRLFVDQARGTASLIIEASDLGSALTFTCRAISSAGSSQPSNEVLLIPG